MSEHRLDPSIFKFIFRYSKVEQIYVTALTALMFPLLYVTLELPKMIVNRAIGGQDFPQTVFGVEFDQIEYLLVLCFVFLGLVLIAGGLKYYVSVYRGRLGERMLRRLRFQLYANVLRFPLPHFKRVSQGEIIPMITSEVEPLGGFVGDALALPLLQGGTLVTYMVFIFIQDPLLGLAAIALYPLQIYLIPKLQRKVNQLAKRRVLTVRRLADRIGEAVSGVSEIHANDTSRLMRADLSNRLNTIYEIRYEIFKRKFFIKFLNNFLGQLTPFFFYSIGGYFVIKGDLSFGALVAVIAAYKDLASPWKELLDFYQIAADTKIKYEQVVEQFEPEGMLPAEKQLHEPETIEPLTGTVTVSNLRLTEDGRVFQLDGVSFSLAGGQRLAVVGSGGSGKDELTRVLANLLTPSAGTIDIGERRLGNLPETVTGRRIGYVDSSAYIFSASIYDNLTLGLRWRPMIEPSRAGEDKASRERYIHEAKVSSNSPDDVDAEWIDYAAAEASGRDDLISRIDKILELVDMDTDIYNFGLRGKLDARHNLELADKFLEARNVLHNRLEETGAHQLVEPFDADRYNTNATLAENLLFGTPIGEAFDFARMAENSYVISVLEEEDLTEELLQIGYRVAETMVEIFAGLPPGHEFFAQYSFIDAEELPEYQTIVSRTSVDKLASLKDEERTRLISLPFFLIESRHRLGLIDADMKARIVAARHHFATHLPEEFQGQIEFFDAEKFNLSASIQDNILFGKIAYGQAQAESKVLQMIAAVVKDLDLRDHIVEVGLSFDVGIAGSRLSSAQRQKLAIARALLKRPDILVLNEAITPLDSSAQVQVLGGVLGVSEGKTLIWALHRASLAERFDRVLVMAGGKVAEEGTFEELNREGSVLRQLLDSE